jgi:Cu+-exporting ATPase
MTHDQTGSEQQVELVIGGMTCASCATRIERKLNKVDGVNTTVNFATEKGRVSLSDGLSTQDVIKVVEGTGYTATAPDTAPRPRGRGRRVAASTTSTPVRCASGCWCRSRWRFR